MAANHLYFIGLGLYNERDISLHAHKILKTCDKIYAEFYTSKLIGLTTNTFEETYGKPLHILSREETEKPTQIIEAAKTQTVAFLCGGDTMMATTHVDLRMQAHKQGIPTTLIHNSSIVTAAPALLGLQYYKFGRTTTLAYPEKDYFPTSPYTVIADNKQMGLHTLILLDIQQHNNKYMTANEGLQLLRDMEDKEHKHLITDKTLACVVARAGSPTPHIAANELKSLLKQDFGGPLHTLIIPGNLHFMELEALELLAGLPSSVAKKIQKV